MVDKWRRSVVRALMGLGALTAVGCNPEPEPDARAVAVVQRMRSLTAPTAPEGTRSRAVLPPSTVERVRLAEDGLVADWGTQASRPGSGHTARVVLPEDARLPFHLRDATSGLSLFVTREGARPAEAQVVDGYVVYTGAHTEGADVLHRFTPEGTEDYVAFERAPASPGVTYGLRLGDRVAGLRLVDNTLELLDAGGAPRLRMAPPYLVGQDGHITPADISVEGCATDTLPAAPWGRRVTEPGARYCQVHVAWRAEDVKYPAVLDPSWTTTGSLVVGRANFTATTLQDGKVLAVGGHGATGYLSSAEVYDPVTGTWAATGAMSVQRRLHTSTLLGTGKVLVAGGHDVNTTFQHAELYDPATGTWSSAGYMNRVRSEHTATVLGDGRVLVAGGFAGSNSVAGADLYDPATGYWIETGLLIFRRYGHSAELLADGRVLVFSGWDNGALTNAEIYNPATGTWSLTGSSISWRSEQSSARLADGRVLVTGGDTNLTELYDPATGTWSLTGDLPGSRRYATALPLPDGRVFIVGGTGDAGAAMYEPTVGKWVTSVPPQVPRSGHAAALLADGRVLIAGGRPTGSGGAMTSTELFSPGPRDQSPPTVSLTSPEQGATLRGTVPLTASASDDTGVTRVEFYIGSSLYGTVWTPPYTLNWNTQQSSNGSRTLTVKAYDAIGFVSTSPAVTVTLDNDQTPPTVTLTAPSAGSSVQGMVTVSANASDVSGVNRVEFYVSGSRIGTATTAPYSVQWSTSSFNNGGHTLTARAYDSFGNMGQSTAVQVTVTNPGGSTVGYDTTLGAPRCVTTDASCDSGTLLNGRANLGPEPNQPNTVDSCTDGTSGGYHSDESLDRLKVSTLDGSPLQAGKTIRIEATVWGYSGYASDQLDLYYAPDASTPGWTLIGTMSATTAGSHVLSTTYTLPSATSRAVVRGVFRYGGSPGPCPGGSYTDVDDLVFSAQ